MRAALDEELAGLPDSLRAPLLLCYFDGMTQDEAATKLGWNKRTVKSRIERGRRLLRGRLTRRGIELPAVLAVQLLSPALASAVPAAVVAALASAAVLFAGYRSPAAGVSAVAIELARTEVPVTHFFWPTLALSAAGLLVAASLSFADRRGSAGDGTTPEVEPAAAQAPAPADAQPQPPAGAVRIGSTQFRHVGWHSRAFLTDGGKTLLVVGDGPTVRFWEAESGKQLHEMTLTGLYNAAAFAPGAGLLAVVGVHWPKGREQPSEGALWLVDTNTRKLVRTVGLPDASGSNSAKVCITADGKRVFAEYEGDVRVIDGKTGDELIRHKGRINAGTMAVSRDGKTIAFGRYDVYLWRWETGEEPKKFAPIGGFGTELIAFDPDGKSLLVASSGGRVTRFEVPTGRQIGTLDLGRTPWKMEFSPDGRSLAVVSHSAGAVRGNHVVLYDPATGKEQAKFSVGQTKASHVSWSADGTRIAATTDYRAWVWDVKTAKPIGPASTGHEGMISAFAFGPDGRLFTASDDHTVRSWDAATGKPGLELIHDSWVRDVALSLDGSLVAGSALDDDLRIWDAKTGTERFKLLGNGRMGGTRRVQFTPDGKRLVAWGDDLYLRVWDTRNGKLLVENRTVPEGLTEADLEDENRMERELMGSGGAALSGDGSTFAYSRYKVVQIYDVETGKERTRFEGDPNGITSLALSPDGKRVAIAGRGKSIETRLPGGRTQYTTSKELQVAVWDIATQKPVWQGTSEGSWPRLAYSHDGSRLAATSNTEEKAYAVRVWDANTGKDLGRIDLPERGSHLALDRTGKRFAVSQGNTTAMVFDLETALKPNEPKR